MLGNRVDVQSIFYIELQNNQAVIMLQAHSKKKLKWIYVIVIAAVLIAAVLSYFLSAVTAPAATGPGPVKIEVSTDKPLFTRGTNSILNLH
jgi:hypothetical protein